MTLTTIALILWFGFGFMGLGFFLGIVSDLSQKHRKDKFWSIIFLSIFLPPMGLLGFMLVFDTLYNHGK